MDPDIIVKAFEYTVDKKNIKSIRYVSGIIRNWYDNGILDMDKLEQYLETNDKRFVYYNRVFKSLGFGFRQPSKAEKDAMDTWFNEWNLSLDLVLKACENSKKTSNPNINYINSILLAWKKDGITTPEEVEVKKQEHLDAKEIKESNDTKSMSKTTKSRGNKFHNFKQRTTKYSNEELEKILGIKK